MTKHDGPRPTRWSPEVWLHVATTVRSWLAAGHVGLAAVLVATIGAIWLRMLDSLAQVDDATRLLQPALTVSTLLTYALLWKAGRRIRSQIRTQPSAFARSGLRVNRAFASLP